MPQHESDEARKSCRDRRFASARTPPHPAAGIALHCRSTPATMRDSGGDRIRAMADKCRQQTRAIEQAQVTLVAETPRSARRRFHGEHMLSKKWAAPAVALTLLSLLGACGRDDANDGNVRVVNATTDYASIDLYTQDSDSNDTLVVSGTAAGTVSGYNNVKRGSKTFEIKSGTSAGNASSATGNVTTDDHFTLVSYITGNTLDTVFLSEEENNPSSGNAKLRILNGASTEAGSVDVYLSQNACNALSTTDTAFAPAVAGPSAGAAFTTAYSQVTAASAGTKWNLCVTSGGDKSTVLLDIPTFTLKAQEIATLILTRTAGGVLLNASLLDQQGALTPFANSIARVRVVADAAASGTVSTTVNGVSLTGDAASPSISSYVAVPSGAVTGTYAINDTPINGVTLSALSAGSDYTLFIGGTTSAPTVTLIQDNNTPSTSTSLPVEARVLNGVNGVNGTVTANAGGKQVGSNVAFGVASTYTPITAFTGTATLNVSIGGVPQPAQVNQTFTSGNVYTILVYGDSSAPQIVINQDN
jgi:hypothetical protein